MNITHPLLPLQDFRFGLRMLRKNPGFATVVLLTLALGITVNAIVFNFASEFFLRPLPAKNPDQLVVIAQTAPVIDYQFPLSYADAVDLRRMVEATDSTTPDMARVFSGLMAYSERTVHLSRTGESAERTWIHAVTENYFSLLGAQPARGRFFLPDEAQRPGADPIIVLTHDTWRSRFGADPSIIGQTVTIDSLPFTVVGIANPGFFGASWGTALSGFVPATMLPQLSGGQPWVLSRGNTAVFLMGRLQPGASVKAAQAAMNVALARLIQANPGKYFPNSRIVVMSERMSRPSPYVSHHVPAIIAALMTLALLVLIITGANVANLLYARATSREHEVAIRAALGASRGRLLRALLAESVLLALGAGAVGMLASLWLVPMVQSALPTPTSIPPAADTGIDWRPFVFGFILSLLTGLAAGLMPALKATGLAIQPLLKNNAGTSGGRRHPMRSLLVVGQVAVSCVVLVCAGMAVRSLHNLLQTRLGFHAQNLVVASFDLGRQRYEPNRGRDFHARLLEKVRALPGVRAASLVDFAPFDTRTSLLGGIVPEGQPADAYPLAILRVLGEHTALNTLGLPLIAGREFTARDDFGAPRVAVINQVLADLFWPGQDPLGKRVSVQGDAVEVVGLLGEIRYFGIQDRNRPLLIQPLAQNYRGGATLIIRNEGATAPLASAIGGIFRQMDPDLPLCDIQTMEQQIATSPAGLLPYRMGAILAGGQGLIALFLAGLGIFGLASINVTRRTREIGIRMALGATRAAVIRLIARESLLLTLTGLGVGSLLSAILTRLLSGLLYEVSPIDTLVFTSVTAGILGTTWLAIWLPTHRATRIDPMQVLRNE